MSNFRPRNGRVSAERPCINGSGTLKKVLKSGKACFAHDSTRSRTWKFQWIRECNLVLTFYTPTALADVVLHYTDFYIFSRFFLNLYYLPYLTTWKKRNHQLIHAGGPTSKARPLGGENGKSNLISSLVMTLVKAELFGTVRRVVQTLSITAASVP